MPKITVTVQLRPDGPRDIEADAVPGTPHLAIHRTVPGSNPTPPEHTWALTHVPSGLVILQARRKGTVQSAAGHLALIERGTPAQLSREDEEAVAGTGGVLGLGRDAKEILKDRYAVSVLWHVRTRAAEWDNPRHGYAGRPLPVWWIQPG